jgi:hypothetical protein
VLRSSDDPVSYPGPTDRVTTVNRVMTVTRLSSVALAAVGIVLWTAVPGLRGHDVPALAMVSLFLGVPHGAVDYLLPQHDRWRLSRVTVSATIGLYLAAFLAGVVVVLISPLVAYYGVLAMSIFHWGSGDAAVRQECGGTPVRTPAVEVLAYGGSAFISIAFWPGHVEHLLATVAPGVARDSRVPTLVGGIVILCAMAVFTAQMVVCEREAHPGGRAGLLETAGYRFDTGPTVLTMPDLIENALAAVGERLADWLTLLPVTPLYRATFHDGSRLDVHADVDAMAEEIGRVCGAAEAAGYRRFVDFASRLYRYQMVDFHRPERGFPARPAAAQPGAVAGDRRLPTAGPKVASYLRDPRTQRIFSFQAMYAGVAPTRALALYAVISYMDTVRGVYFPEGGIHALPRAMAGAAEKHGVRFRYGTTVTRVEMRGTRAVAVHTAEGERVPADVVVLNPDLPVAYERLLGRVPGNVRRLTYSPSCFLLLAGSSAAYPGTVHHNLRYRHCGHPRRSTATEGLYR